jgi:hypothetical protein
MFSFSPHDLDVSPMGLGQQEIGHPFAYNVTSANTGDR